jgi:hypothetical protein
MGRETLDQAAFAGLHSVTKPVQVLTTVHAKSRGLAPRHWLRGGRLSLGKGRRSNKQKDYSDERPTSDTVRHLDNSIASAPRGEITHPSWSGLRTAMPTRQVEFSHYLDRF